jgi:hypothetical protein
MGSEVCYYIGKFFDPGNFRNSERIVGQRSPHGNLQILLDFMADHSLRLSPKAIQRPLHGLDRFFASKVWVLELVSNTGPYDLNFKGHYVVSAGLHLPTYLIKSEPYDVVVRVDITCSLRSLNPWPKI